MHGPLNVKSEEDFAWAVLTLWRLTTLKGVVPHRQPLKVAFYIFIQQIEVLNILNMAYTLSYFLFKMQFVS
jgi:hypothetical protein